MKRLKKQDKDKSKVPKKRAKKKTAVKKPAAKLIHKQINRQAKPGHRKIKTRAKKKNRVGGITHKKIRKKQQTAKRAHKQVRHSKKRQHGAKPASRKTARAAEAVLSFLKNSYARFKIPEKKKAVQKGMKLQKKETKPEKKVWKIHTTTQKYLLGPKIAVVCFVFFITLVIVLHNRGRFDVSNPLSAALLALVFVAFTAYSLTGFYKAVKMKEKGAAFMIDEYKPCLICRPCMETERMLGVPGAFLKFIGSRASDKFHSPNCRLAKRITKEHLISLNVRTKGVKVRRPHAHRMAVTLFIFAITAILILHKKGVFDIRDPASIAGLAIVFALFFVYIAKGAVRVSKAARQKSGIKAAGAMRKLEKPRIAKADRYETDIDRLYRLINETGRISVSAAAEIFSLKKEEAEEWGRILESHGLIEIEYPAVGEVQLCKKSLQHTE